jgi:DNA-binding beta-propeller fold protein YncE
MLLAMPAAAAPGAPSPAAQTGARLASTDVGCTAERADGALLARGARGICDPAGGTGASAAPLAAAPTAAATPACLPDPAPELRCASWESRYNGPAGGSEGIGGLISHRMVAVSPDGATVYGLGAADTAAGAASDLSLLVVAFDVATGARRWAYTFTGTQALPSPEAMAVAVAPDGKTVFATATLYDGADQRAISTVAIDAASGVERWRVVEDSGTTSSNALAVDPLGARVYVAGQRAIDDGSVALTLAYDAVTGETEWVAEHTAPNGRTGAWRIAANPDGQRLYVAAADLDEGGATIDVVLLVLDTATGAQRAATHFPTKGFPPAGIAVSADGSTVVVEEANLATSLNNALTLAYDAEGKLLWNARFGGCDQFKCSARPWYSGPVAVSADGSRVFVTSLGVLVAGGTVFHTTAYNGRTGAQLWTTAHPWNAGDCFCGPSVATSADGRDVYISTHAYWTVVYGTGEGLTLAYDGETGQRRWSAVTAEPGAGVGTGHLALTPDGKRLLVGGAAAQAVASGDDYADVLMAAFPTGR